MRCLKREQNWLSLASQMEEESCGTCEFSLVRCTIVSWACDYMKRQKVLRQLMPQSFKTLALTEVTKLKETG